MQPLSDQELTTTLHKLRPAPEAEFASRLDARVAAGFAREGQPSAIRRLMPQLRPTRRQMLTASAAGAVATVVIATVVVALTSSIGGPSQESKLSHGPIEFEGSPSSVVVVPRAASGRQAQGPSAHDETEASNGASSSGTRVEVSPPITGPYASQAHHRDIQHAASIVLHTDPGEVRQASAKVFEAVHAVDGIVLSSSIRDGGEGGSGSFDLLVPSGRLGDALASFSSIATVVSRHESTADVTARTVGLGERLQDARATVSSLLAQLAAAESDAERATAQAELRAERRHVATLRAQLTTLERRTHFSRVSLRIVSGDAGTAVGDGEGSWGVGSALADAGRILEIAAGVTLVGFAAIVPIALFGALAWLGRRRWLDASRRRALG